MDTTYMIMRRNCWMKADRENIHLWIKRVIVWSLWVVDINNNEQRIASPKICGRTTTKNSKRNIVMSPHLMCGTDWWRKLSAEATWNNRRVLLSQFSSACSLSNEPLASTEYQMQGLKFVLIVSVLRVFLLSSNNASVSHINVHIVRKHV